MSETVRKLSSLPLVVIEELAELAPSQARRFVRELCARARLEKAQGRKAEISSHYQDSKMTLDNIHRVLGVVVCAYLESLSTKDRLKLNLSAMDSDEKNALMNALLAEPEDEPPQPTDCGELTFDQQHAGGKRCDEEGRA